MGFGIDDRESRGAGRTRHPHFDVVPHVLEEGDGHFLARVGAQNAFRDAHAVLKRTKVRVRVRVTVRVRVKVRVRVTVRVRLRLRVRAQVKG